MSKVALGSLDLHFGLTDLEDVVHKALSQIAADEAARVIVTVDGAITTDPASTSATGGRSALSGIWDASRLGQVVSNLITNALKYSASDTTVEIELEGQEQPEGSVTLRVRDDGIGIPPADIERVFSRYSRAKNAEESGIEGQGLGLYLCRGIVRAHGGHIQAESKGLGQGTTITVVLPKQGPVA
jgi:signal transduction histidine kinase